MALSRVTGQLIAQQSDEINVFTCHDYVAVYKGLIYYDTADPST